MNETKILTLQTGEGSSETTRSASPIETINNEYKFFLKLVSWAAISKAGYISCEITMHTKEVQTLYFFKLGRFKKRIFIRSSRSEDCISLQQLSLKIA